MRLPIIALLALGGCVSKKTLLSERQAAFERGYDAGLLAPTRDNPCMLPLSDCPDESCVTILKWLCPGKHK